MRDSQPEGAVKHHIADVLANVEREATSPEERRRPSRRGSDSAAPALGTGGCRLGVYMKTTTIRVTAETRDRLNALARRRGAGAGEIVAELVREADDRALLADAEEGWRQLAADPEALAAHRAEASALEQFDAPLSDY